jgi:hypothetical protein
LAQVRLAGDRYVFLEYGPMELDINLRVRYDLGRYIAVHPTPHEAVHQHLKQRKWWNAARLGLGRFRWRLQKCWGLHVAHVV